MDMRNTGLSVLLAICCSASHGSELLQPRSYHADEASVATQGQWLALQAIDNHWQLVKDNPGFHREDDAVLGPMEGIRVSTDLPGVLFLLMDESLSVGPVQSAWETPNDKNAMHVYEKSRLPDVGKTTTFHFNQAVYELRNIDGMIVIASQGKTQTLFPYSEAYESNARLEWLGDLDRDGKLDLIVDASDHYNVGESRLYLSANASPNALLRLVATRRTTGC